MKSPGMIASRKGATAVEMAVVLLLFLSILLGVLEFGRYFFLVHVTLNATREGGRFAAAHTGDGTNTQDIINVVNNFMVGQQTMIENYTVEVLNVDPTTGNAMPNSIWTEAQFGGAIMVRISGNYRCTMPILFFLPAVIPVLATSIVNSEGT